MALFYSDDFNRADSATIGTGWSEVSLNTNDVGIISNRLQFPYSGPDTDAAVAYRSRGITGAKDMSVITGIRHDSAGTFDDISGVSISHNGSVRGVANGIYLRFNWSSDTISILDRTNISNNELKGEASFSLSDDVTYYVRWDIESDYAMRVYINTTGTTFSSSDLIIEIAAFTPNSSISPNLALGQRFYDQFDFIETHTPVLAAAGGGGGYRFNPQLRPFASL